MIPNPCSQKWEDLPGDDRRRFCGECGRDVHALATYSSDEWTALMKQGRLCAYTGETVPVLPSRRTLIAGALLTTIAPLFGQTGTLRVLVTNAAGSSGGAVTLVSADGTKRVARADASGVAEFANLPIEEYSVTVQDPGFVIWRGKYAVNRGAEELRVRLEVGSLGGYIELAVVE